jgi:SNF2 family DNA or RNA helicase
MAWPSPQITVPNLRPGVAEIVRPFQAVDATALCLYKRFIIGEYPGAGKKLIAILAILKNFELGRSRNVLIVSLGSDVQQWVEEFRKFTTGIEVLPHRGTKANRRASLGSPPQVLISSYQAVQSDWADMLGVFDTVVLDEVSYIRNPESDAALTVGALCAPSLEDQVFFRQMKAWLTDCRKAERAGTARPDTANPKYQLRPYPIEPVEYCWPLTATPMETGPLDLFALCRNIYGRQSPLGYRIESFKRQFCDVRKFNVRTAPKPGRTRGAHLTIEKIRGIKDENALDNIRVRLDPCYIRHPFETVGKYLPPIEVIPDWLELTKRQEDRYAEIGEGNVILDYVRQESGRRIHSKQVTAAIKLFYLLRCCDGLTSLPNQNYRDSSKLNRCRDMLTTELGDQKVIVFSRFHQPLDDLERMHEQEGRLFVRIDGLHDDAHNDAARIAFTTSTQPITLLMTGKGSYALNLQEGCNYGISFNTLYNPKRCEQLYGRNRRPKPGHTGDYDDNHKVIWYHLLCRRTVEEAQWLELRRRDQEFRDIFGLADELFEHLTPGEQEAILEYRGL